MGWDRAARIRRSLWRAIPGVLDSAAPMANFKVKLGGIEMERQPPCQGPIVDLRAMDSPWRLGRSPGLHPKDNFIGSVSSHDGLDTSHIMYPWKHGSMDSWTWAFPGTSWPSLGPLGAPSRPSWALFGPFRLSLRALAGAGSPPFSPF